MNSILTISNLASLCQVSTETLRHYDRIGLLKPYKINKITRERLYSINQYEQLSTIKELKQLGFSLQEIKYYLQNCNIETTQDLLSKSLKIVNSKIQELSEIKKTIEVKKNLRDYSNLKKVPQGKYLTLTYEGEFWNAQVYINKLINHSKNHHISITNNFIQTQWLDYTFINEKNKLVYEIQVKML